MIGAVTKSAHHTEHEIGGAFITIDVNERNFPGHEFRELIFRVRRKDLVQVYRVHISDHELPKRPAEAKQYLLSHVRMVGLPPLFCYREALRVVK